MLRRFETAKGTFAWGDDHDFAIEELDFSVGRDPVANIISFVAKFTWAGDVHGIGMVPGAAETIASCKQKLYASALTRIASLNPIVVVAHDESGPLRWVDLNSGNTIDRPESTE